MTFIEAASRRVAIKRSAQALRATLACDLGEVEVMS